MTSLRRRAVPYFLLGPGTIWLLVFFVVPLYYLGKLSLESGFVGEFHFNWNWSNYSEALSNYDTQFIRSFTYAGTATLLSLIIAYPLAYVIAFKAGRWKNVLLFAVVAPFFTTYLIRTIAWETILSDESPVTNVLQAIGLAPSGHILATSGAVIAGLTYNFLPFMILPLYASLDRIDERLIEAAKDLYSSATQSFLRVTLPLSAPGIVAGTLLTFIPAAGDYVNAQFLGGAGNRMIGNVIQSLYLSQADYPAAAALAFVLMAPLYGPYLKSGANTWGDLVNLDGEGSDEVRRYILDNVLMWLRDYHVDGLRLDAVHAPRRLLRGAPAGGDGGRGRRAVGPPAPAADPDRGVRPQRPAAGHAPRGRRLRARRAVERRLPPRRARGADPGDRRLLRRLRAARRRWPRWCERGFFHDGTFSSFREPRPRRPDRHRGDAHLAAGGLQPEPRPDRQPRRRRPHHRGARRRPARLRGAADPGRAVHADAVPGRGVGGLDAVPVLHLAPGARARAWRRPRAGSRSSSGWAGTRTSYPTRRTPRRSAAPSWTGRSSRPDGTPGCSTSTGAWPRYAASLPRAHRPVVQPTACRVDEDTRLFKMWRGDLHVVVNFGDAEP